MYTFSLLLLLAGINFPDGTQAAKDRLSRRQSSSSPVELWGACNYPSQGINGPLPCASGSECICKDESKCKTFNFLIDGVRAAPASRRLLLMTLAAYAQCRKQLDGSWAPDPSWQCQQPGNSASSSSTSNTPSTGGTSSGSANQDTNPQNTNLGGDSTPSNPGNQQSGSGSSQAATIGDCTTASAPGGWDGVASTSVSSLVVTFLWWINAEESTIVLRLPRQRLRLWPKRLAMGRRLRRLQRRRQPETLPRQA